MSSVAGKVTRERFTVVQDHQYSGSSIRLGLRKCSMLSDWSHRHGRTGLLAFPPVLPSPGVERFNRHQWAQPVQRNKQLNTKSIFQRARCRHQYLGSGLSPLHRTSIRDFERKQATGNYPKLVRVNRRLRTDEVMCAGAALVRNSAHGP